MLVSRNDWKARRLGQAVRACAKLLHLNRRGLMNSLLPVPVRITHGSGSSIRRRAKLNRTSAGLAIAVGYSQEGQRILALRLSPREMQILRLAALGQTSKEIAATLDIRERTVNWHLASVFRKLGVESRTEAVVLALEHGLIPPPHGMDRRKGRRRP